MWIRAAGGSFGNGGRRFLRSVIWAARRSVRFQRLGGVRTTKPPQALRNIRINATGGSVFRTFPSTQSRSHKRVNGQRRSRLGGVRKNKPPTALRRVRPQARGVRLFQPSQPPVQFGRAAAPGLNPVGARSACSIWKGGWRRMVPPWPGPARSAWTAGWSRTEPPGAGRPTRRTAAPQSNTPRARSRGPPVPLRSVKDVGSC